MSSCFNWALNTLRNSLFEAVRGNTPTIFTKLTCQISSLMVTHNNGRERKNPNGRKALEERAETLNSGLRLAWMALENLDLSISGWELNPSFSTTNIASCSGPPFGGALLTAAVSRIPSSARLHTRSISTELVWRNENQQKSNNMARRYYIVYNHNNCTSFALETYWNKLIRVIIYEPGKFHMFIINYCRSWIDNQELFIVCELAVKEIRKKEECTFIPPRFIVSSALPSTTKKPPTVLLIMSPCLLSCWKDNILWKHQNK